MKKILIAGTAIAFLALSPGAGAQNRAAPQPAPQPARPAQPTPAPAPAPAAATEAPQNQARVSGWTGRCIAAARAALPECAIEQNMVRISNGQTVMTVIIRVIPETRSPVLQVQVPFGGFLPGGLRLRTDTGIGLDLAFQTCDQRGCFVGNPVSPEFLAALKAAKRLEATVQNMAREPQILSMPMDGFAAAYERVQ